MNSQLHISVVVCTRDRPALLEQCLVALTHQTYRNFEIVVVDNAPRMSAREACLRHGARYVVEPVPGLTRARNTGALAARGEWIAYTDDDAIADPRWLATLAAEFSDPAVAVVTGGIRYYKARDDSRVMSDEAADGVLRPRARFDRSTPDWFTLATLGGIGDGGNMAFRRTLFDQYIRFDDRLGRGRLLEGGDEHVMFAAVIAHGHAIVHCPEALVRHPCAGTPARERAERLRTERASIAYLMFLWSEFPGHRADIARFVARALRKRLHRRGHRWPALRACVTGPFVYWRARRAWQTETPARQPAREVAASRSSS